MNSGTDSTVTAPVVLLTGATAGIGEELARRFAADGATLVCVARDATKAERLVADLRQTTGNERISHLLGDLSRPSQVRDVARAFAERHDRLDVLFNNAGALFATRRLTEDGLERTFALNHLSYFVMTVLLLPRLKVAREARVVSTSSGAHRWGDLGFLDDLQTERFGVGGRRAYGRSKLANIWFTRELARRLDGTRVTANCYHPGFVASQFATNNGVLSKVAMTFARPFARNVERGADTGYWLATRRDASNETGGYWFDRTRRHGTRAARDADAPARLWGESERIVAGLLGDDWAREEAT